MNRFPHLAQRVFNRPVAILPEKAEVIMAVLADRLGVTEMFRPGSQIKPAAWFDDDDWEPREPTAAETRGYEIVAGTAIIEISGTLVQKTGSLQPFSGMTGYDGIRQCFLNALADPEVAAIVLDIDSPGGEVSGCFDLVDTIYQARGAKPIWSILNESAFSAGYALASAADRITVPRTGGVGSIGVVCCHVDWSKALSGAGIAVTFIQYGARKTDYCSEKPLSADARDRLQEEIDTMGRLFVDTVARNRNIAASVVQATEAATYLGAAGVDANLADAVMAPDAAFRALTASLP